MIICNIYKVNYTGKLSVTEIKNSEGFLIGYTLKIGLNTPDQPFCLSYEGDSENFIKFVTNELRNSNLHIIEYYKGVRNYDEGYYNRTHR